MNETAMSEQDTELHTILRRRGPDIEWLMIHGETDYEDMLWVRVRAMQAARLVQFVVTVSASEKANSDTIAARILNEALRLLSK